MEQDFTPWPDSLAEQYLESGCWQQKTLVDYLDKSVDNFGDNTAIICGNSVFSYREMRDKITGIAHGLLKLGLRPGDSVILQMTNIAEFYFCFFALLQNGIRPVMALPAHRHQEISYFCQHTQAKAYLTDGSPAGFDYQKQALAVAGTCPLLQWIIVTGEVRIEDERFVALNQLTGTGPFDEVTPATKPDDVAFFQLSGGTTGTPKLIPRTHRDYAYSVVGSIDICRIQPETRFLCVLPAAHNYPMSSPGALGVFFAGGCVVMAADPSPGAAFKLIEKHRVNFVPLVPPLALLWMELADKTESDISSLEIVQVGGAKFSATAAGRLPEKLNCRLQQVFGMAEGLVNYTRLDDPPEQVYQTQGRPISSRDQIRIVDESGRDVPPGEEGLLLTQGPYTIRGYFRAPEHNARSFTADGFYRTGDIVRQTEEGNLIVTGRDKDQINRGGEKIAAEEIENLLLRHPQVHDVALIAVPDDFLGERSCAVVVKRGEENLRPVVLKKFLHQSGLADFKIPDLIHFTGELPKTPVGKINKKLLREIYADGGLIQVG
ncbi:(2,3-dihydroxybenzoyl)adenylate synthase [Vibrio quintilis]|uniref:Long-chain-fatty-acid--CoA ligase n=1 Tax=Vibrio quintilis TaxID=1117707 RepID=A0A1M7YXK2_9VIBR|nr:(2,3-dihydroxybenzoyl)adenylate synthase [Vibrio quintilis]SHO57196.1 2,3-dihydroxybenzoate-AMP ligase [Vibrio quintilis]